MSSPIRRCAGPVQLPAFGLVDYSKSICSGLLDYWPTSEGAGPIQSAGIQGLAGTLGSGATWTTLSTGRAISFSSAAVTTSGSWYNWERTQPWSVSFWVYPTTLGSAERCFFSTLDPANNFKGWEVSLETNNTLRAFAINSFPSNATKASTTTTLSINTLYYVVVTYNGGSTSASFNFYLNGALLSQTASGVDALSATIVSTIPLRFGNRSNASIPYAGQMWNAAIWNRVLTAQEVTTLYTQPTVLLRAMPTQWNFGTSGAVTTTYYLWPGEVEEAFNVLTY